MTSCAKGLSGSKRPLFNWISGVAVAVDADNPRVDAETSGWFFHPLIDVIFICGGLVWILFATHCLLVRQSAAVRLPALDALLWISTFGAIFLAEVHTAATAVRVGCQSTVRSQLPTLFRKTFPFACLLLTAGGVLFPPATAVLIKIYLLLIPQHFMAQSYGLAKLYCIKQNYRLKTEEDIGLKILMWSTISLAVCRQLSFKEWSGDRFLGEVVPFWQLLLPSISHHLEPVVFACFGLVVVVFAVNAVERGRALPFPAVATMITAVAAFTMDFGTNAIYWLYVSAFYHATQYLAVIVSSHLKDVDGVINSAGRARALLRNSGVFRLLGLIVLVSVFIYMGLPQILQKLGANLSASAAALFAGFNLYHIGIDAVIWKLRKPDLRKSLS